MIRALSIVASAFALSGCVLAVGNESAAPVASAPAGRVPAGMQYLYGSGEAVAAGWQAYTTLAAYVLAHRRDTRSVLLAPGATPDAPRWQSCGGRPPAIVLDIDETAVLNTGYEYADAVDGAKFDAGRWDRWERTGADAVESMPGAVVALDRVRAAGVQVIFNSNRSAANAAATEAMLVRLGLGPARHGETLFLKGDTPGGSGKDARRAIIGQKWCVIAMVGDQLGDFSDQFNASGPAPLERRGLANAPEIAPLWGNGWFLLPNPVYGTALAGDIDQIFPGRLRWTDTQGAK